MMRNKKTWLLNLLTLTLYCGGLAAEPEDWTQVIVAERRAGNPYPILSSYGARLSIAQAYRVQRELVAAELPLRVVGGYKAGFTAPGSGARFNLEAPVFGVLFADGSVATPYEINGDDFHRLMVEVEVGFELRSAITRRMRSIDDLRTYVKHARPVIELSDLHYEDLTKLRGSDIVATNMAAGAYIAGEPLQLADLEDVNQISVVLSRDGEVIDEGLASTALGNQLRALLWLVNEVVASGQPLEAGFLLITGTLGKLNPGRPGTYHARFSDAGAVRFQILGEHAHGERRRTSGVSAQ